MSTPSDTMFTATIQGSRRSRERDELLRRPRLGVEHDQRRAAGALAQQRGDPARVARVGGDHQAAGVAVAGGSHRRELGVGLAQDPRQAVGQLGRDRRPVTAPGLARAQHRLEARLDHVVAAAPGQRPVVGDEADRPADPIAHGVGICVGVVGLRERRPRRSYARNRGRVGAKRRARQQQPSRARAHGRGEPLAPGQLLAEVVGLVGDDQRRRRQRSGPPPRRLGDPGIRDRDAVKALRGRGESQSGASSTPSALARAPTDGSAAPSGTRRSRT